MLIFTNVILIPVISVIRATDMHIQKPELLDYLGSKDTNVHLYIHVYWIIAYDRPRMVKDLQIISTSS